MTIIETRLQGLTVSIIGSGGLGVPAGGVKDQVLTKASNTDFDLEWSTPAGAGDMLKAIYDPDEDGVIQYIDIGNTPDLSIYPRKANNTVVINSESDFPTQDATTITLEANTIYRIGTPITTAKKFIIQNGASLTSESTFALGIIYTGVEGMFTSTNTSYIISDIAVSCPNGTLVEFNGDGISIIERIAVVETKNLGVFNGNGINNFCNCNWSNCNFGNITGQGLVFTGNINILSYTKIFNVSSSATHIGINLGTSVFQTIEIRDYEAFGVSGSVAISGLPNSGNLAAGKLATVDSCGLNGILMTPLQGLTITDVRWVFTGCNGVEDTVEDCLLHFRGSTTETTIVDPSEDGSNAVKVNAVWSANRFSKFTYTTDGRITYLGERPVTVPVDVSLHLISVGGGSITAAVYIKMNDGLIYDTGSTVDISGNTSKNIHIPWQVTFSPNDWFEIWIENTTNSNNIIVKQGIVRVR